MCGRMQESGLTEIIPLICVSALWGQDPVFSHPEFPQGSPAHRPWWLQLLMRRHPFFTDVAAIFHFSVGEVEHSKAEIKKSRAPKKIKI